MQINTDSFFIGGERRKSKLDKSQDKSAHSKLLDLEHQIQLVDLQNNKLNENRDRIHDARERIRKRATDKSPDEDKSMKSKKSRGKREKLAAKIEIKTATSGGLASANESQIQFDGISQEKAQDFFGTASYNNTSTNNFNFSKVKQRDFSQIFSGNKMILQLGAEKYDTFNDISEIVLKVKETLEAQKIQWKGLLNISKVNPQPSEEKKLYFLIKKCLIEELWKLEDRKKVRRELEEKKRRREAKLLEEEYQKQQEALVNSPSRSASPVKIGGMNYDKKSESSPTKKRALDEMSVVFSDDNKSHMTGMSKTSFSKLGHNLLQADPEGGI